MFCSSYTFTQNTLPPTGNVGIGTTTPAASLDVVGNTNLGGAVTIDSAVTVRDSATFQKKLTVDQDLKIKGKAVFVDDANFKSDLKVLGVAKMKDKLVVDGLIRMNGDANVFGNFRIKSLADSTSTSDRWLTINSNGKVTSLDKSGLLSAIYDEQFPCFLLPNNQLPTPIWSAKPGVLYTGVGCPASVGIGTDTPVAALDVRGAGFFQRLGINTTPTINEMIKINNSVGTTAGIYLNTNHPQGWPNVKYGFQNVVNNSNTIAYSVTNATTNQDVFVVMGDGKTGIGTATPEGDLQIRSGATKLVIGSSVGEDLGWGTSYIGFNASRQNESTWQTADDSQHNGGSVIYGDIFGSIIFATIPTDPAPASGGQTNIPDATIKTNTRLFVHKDGNVGIGTFTPSAKLMVEAGNNTGLVVTTLHDVNYGYGIRSMVNLNLSKAFAVYNNQAQEESFVVLGNGNVYATRVRVTETPFPDYVFETDYKLLSLNELESYIATNKHLPNMPSAQQVESEGADLGEINRVLVEKVEELTLYIIALNKRMEQMEAENKQIKK